MNNPCPTRRATSRLGSLASLASLESTFGNSYYRTALHITACMKSTLKYAEEIGFLGEILWVKKKSRNARFFALRCTSRTMTPETNATR